MPTLILLATHDAGLAADWERQLSARHTVLFLGREDSPTTLPPGIAAMVILDLAAENLVRPTMQRLPTVLVGEPHSAPFEQARMAGRAKVYLSYEESARKLPEVLPLVEEIAEKQSVLELLLEKNRRTEAPQAIPIRSSVMEPADTAELWDFLEAAIENIDNRDRLLTEFRRASRTLLHASHAVFFVRDADGLRADRGTSFVPIDDPLVAFFENHPAVIDGNVWDFQGDPIAELAVRNRLALWGARLLVPIHDNGRLLGLMAFGVRDDGRPFGEGDRARAIYLARLLRHCLAKATQWTRLGHLAEHANLGARYLPGTLILEPDEQPPRQVPVVVRDLIGQTRRTRRICRVAPDEGQPFRASAGLIVETGGVWAAWEEASAEIRDRAERQRSGRKVLLREMALTISHELGNALVSLATMRQISGANLPPPALLQTVKDDIGKLENLNRQLALMQTLSERDTKPVDLRELAQSIGASLGIKVEVGREPVDLAVSPDLVEFALRSLIDCVAENWPRNEPRSTLAMELRATGEGTSRTALVSLRGRHLELEGVLPEPMEDAVPNQGRLGVFLAKEIIRLHEGEIHAGPGMEGTEILISLRSLPHRPGVAVGAQGRNGDRH
ncbi:MAG: hypothetical protein ACREFX_14550 [Opitutaceae bacterium]